MNEIGERVACFPSFLELCLEMVSAEIAEHQRRRPRLPEARLLSFKAA
jgi:hypothetical protein